MLEKVWLFGCLIFNFWLVKIVRGECWGNYHRSEKWLETVYLELFMFLTSVGRKRKVEVIFKNKSGKIEKFQLV